MVDKNGVGVCATPYARTGTRATSRSRSLIIPIEFRTVIHNRLISSIGLTLSCVRSPPIVYKYFAECRFFLLVPWHSATADLAADVSSGGEVG